MSDYLDAIWSGASRGRDATPEWFRALVNWHARRLPPSIQEDFLSLIAIELLEQARTQDEGTLSRQDAQRAVDRVRKRLLAEIGYSSRYSHRRGASLEKEPQIPDATSQIASRDIRMFLKSVLTTEQMLVLDLQLEGCDDTEIAKRIGFSKRTVQRIRHKTAEIVSRVL